MSSGILLQLENSCGFSEERDYFLWSLQRKPQLLGAVEESSRTASLRVAEKIPKCFVTVNIRAHFYRRRSALLSLSPFFVACVEVLPSERNRPGAEFELRRTVLRLAIACTIFSARGDPAGLGKLQSLVDVGHDGCRSWLG